MNTSKVPHIHMPLVLKLKKGTLLARLFFMRSEAEVLRMGKTVENIERPSDAI